MTAKSGKKRPDEIDIYVGERMRVRRLMLGMSQDALGRALGLTFQQIQKYEKGSNRIGAGRLFRLAKTLQVPVGFFYEDLPGSEDMPATANAASAVARNMKSPEILNLNLVFDQISDPHVRTQIIELIRAIAASTTTEQTGDD